MWSKHISCHRPDHPEINKKKMCVVDIFGKVFYILTDPKEH